MQLPSHHRSHLIALLLLLLAGCASGSLGTGADDASVADTGASPDASDGGADNGSGDDAADSGSGDDAVAQPAPPTATAPTG